MLALCITFAIIVLTIKPIQHHEHLFVGRTKTMTISGIIGVTLTAITSITLEVIMFKLFRR